MQRYGKLAVILNRRHVLIEMDENCPVVLVPGEKVDVFARLESDALRPLGLTEVLAPKGKLSVSMYQTDRLVLAEVFEEGGHYEQRSIASLPNIFVQEVKVGSIRSAEINAADSLEVDFPRALKIGDVVGRV
jgi:hypothetical protein